MQSKVVLSKFYYPLFGLVLGLIIVGVLSILVSITVKRALGSLAAGFSLSFILSSIEEEYVLKDIFRFRAGDEQYFDGKAGLKQGKALNSLTTAIIGFVVAIISLMGA